MRTLDHLRTDLGGSLRRMFGAPTTALPALLAIVLSGSALMLATALLQGVLLRPFAYPNPEQIYALGWQQTPADAWVGRLTADQANFLLAEAHQIAALGSYSDAGTQFVVGGSTAEGALRVSGMRADSGLLSVLGIRPAQGRLFSEDEARSAAKVAVLSARVWQREFGDNRLDDAQLRIDGESYQVIGVLPADFRFYPSVDVIVPSLPGGIGAVGSNTDLLARLPQDASAADVQQRLDALSQRWLATQPGAQPNARIRLRPFAEAILGDSDKLLLPLLAAVAALVLLACVNVANLLVGFALSRRGDTAVEFALGATRRRMVARLACDAAVLWTLGLVLATLVAALTLPLLSCWMPFNIPRLDEVRLDAVSVSLAAAVGLLMTIASALLGTLGARFGSPAVNLRQQGPGRGSGVGAQPLLVSVQVALSCVLLICCATVLGSATRIASTDPGFRSAGLSAVQLAFGDARFRDARTASARTDRVLHALQARLASEHGLLTVASTSSLPLERGLNNWIELPADASHDGGSVEVRIVSPEYLAMLKVPLLAGSGFDGSEQSTNELRMVINQAFAQRYFSAVNAALGTSVRMDGRDWRVIGITADIREAGLNLPALPTVFVARTQIDPAIQAAVNRWFLTALVIEGAPETVDRAVRAALARVDPGVALVGTRSLETVIGSSMATQRFFSGLLIVLAGASLLMTAIGLSGVLMQLATLRRHELAVRLALGSDAARNARLLLTDGARSIALGLMVGVPTAWAAQPLLANLLDDAGFANDLPWLASVTLVLLLACLLAALPALARARRITASQALRSL